MFSYINLDSLDLDSLDLSRHFHVLAGHGGRPPLAARAGGHRCPLARRDGPLSGPCRLRPLLLVPVDNLMALLRFLEHVLKVLGWLTHLGLAGRATPTAAVRVRVPSQIKYVLQTMLQPRG